MTGVPGLGCLAQAATPPNADTAKQVLTKRWMSLKPDWAAERNVLFQDVRAVGQSGGSWQFRVTAAVRDYGKGYPANRFYGQTCVSRFDSKQFTLWSDGSQWKADGAFTASMDATRCVKNAAEGVSSIPLNTLQGAEAAAGLVAAPPAAERSGGVAQGAYECWANGSARMLLNFTVQPGGRYLDSEGKTGSFSYNSANSRIVFRGGAWDGAFPAGYYSIYYEPQGRPTVSIRNPGGSEVAFCQRH